MKVLKSALLPLITAFLLHEAHAVTIQIDYTYGGTFFSNNALAREAVEKAAADLSAAITSQLPAITTSSVSATSGGATASINYSGAILNPNDGAQVTGLPLTLPQDVIRIYVGSRELAGTTLGQGGPGGVGLGFNLGGSTSGFQSAINSTQAQATSILTRGAGPIVATSSGTITDNGNNPLANYSVSYGILMGSMWFDNNGVTWHYDANSAVAVGAFDFYSVALHELIHTIGVGTTATWNSLVSGNNWTGVNVINLLGSGANVVSGGHIRSGLMGTTLEGVAQEAVMDPDILAGTRKVLTDVDLAFLRDLGWQTIPEPGSVAFAGMALSFTAFRRRRDSCS